MNIDEETALDDCLYVENSQDTPIANCYANQEHFVAAIKRRYSYLPWFAEIAIFLATEKEPAEFTGNEKRKFLRDAKLYFWDEPFLYRHFKDGVF